MEYFCTFTRVKLKKQYFYFYWSNILLYVSVLLLKYLICVLCPPLLARGELPPDWARFLAGFFSPFCYRWSFGSLPLSRLACLVGDTSFPAISLTWLHRYYLNWTELDNDITEFNNEMPSTENWVRNLVILHYWHTIFLFWYCTVGFTKCVLLKALFK